MKRILAALLFLANFLAAAHLPAYAAAGEPTIYIIQKGDTLWGLSERFLKDPYYWPNLWAKNPSIGNPHIIVPGQKVKVFSDRIEVEPKGGAASAGTSGGPAEEAVPEKQFLVSGSEGFLLEKGMSPAGHIITTNQNRQMVGIDDIVYTDIGTIHGAKVGDRFSIFKNLGEISHPVNNNILGEKIIPLGMLQLTEVEEKVSKAIITKSYMEIGPGSYLMPYRDKRRQVALKAAAGDLSGYIVETQTGNNAISEGDIIFFDLGRKHGVEPGNLLYVLRDVAPDQLYADYSINKLPAEVIGALVVVQTGENTSTALVVKSIDTIYRGDRVELKKSK